MALFDFFWKRAKQLADTSAQNAVSVINGNIAPIYEYLRRIEVKQKETIIQLEDIDDALHSAVDADGAPALIESFITLTDTINDFYFYASADEGSPLFEQARMMWETAKNAATKAELEIFEAANEPFNFLLHSAENTEEDADIPEGYVIRTLKCGFAYREKIIRRAVVIVNKTADNKLTADKIDEPNILYFPKEDPNESWN